MMPEIVTRKIKSIVRKGSKTVYDVQVSKNHNFFANGILVHNCIIFQEQVMELAEKCAGFPKEQCDEVRRAIMKRSISGGEAAKKAAAETRDSFVKGCLENNYTEETANLLYDRILFFAGYGFNRCVTSETEILITDESGKSRTKKKIIDCNENDWVLSYDESKKTIVPVKIKQLHDNGYNDLVEVKLDTGEVVRCTMNHKFRTRETREKLSLKEILDRELSIVVDPVDESLNSKNHSENTK